jgi:hypothetical protein
MSEMNSIQWSHIISIQGAVTQQHIWPKFKGDVWGYMEFKEHWHKMQKVEVSEKQLLEIMWEDCLPSHIVERPGKFANVATAWQYLDQLFGWNSLCDILQSHDFFPEYVCPQGFHEGFIALFTEFRSRGKEQEWNLMAMHILLCNMPSQERELWHKEGTQERIEMEFWPLELYKFVIRRWEDFEDARRSKRNRVKHKKHRPCSRNSKPLHPAVAVVSVALQGAVSVGKPEPGTTDEGMCEYHRTNKPGQDGHESNDAACDCESEDSNNLGESRD